MYSLKEYFKILYRGMNFIRFTIHYLFDPFEYFQQFMNSVKSFSRYIKRFVQGGWNLGPPRGPHDLINIIYSFLDVLYSSLSNF